MCVEDWIAGCWKNLQMLCNEKRDFRCKQIKDAEMGKLSWTIWVGHKCSHMYPCMREAEADFTTDRREGRVTIETEIGMMQPQTLGYQWPPEQKMVRERPSSELHEVENPWFDSWNWFPTSGLQNYQGYIFIILSHKWLVICYSRYKKLIQLVKAVFEFPVRE